MPKQDQPQTGSSPLLASERRAAVEPDVLWGDAGIDALMFGDGGPPYIFEDTGAGRRAKRSLSGDSFVARSKSYIAD